MGKMSRLKPETEECGWTKANLKNLLTSMKTSIPAGERYSSYIKGMKAVDWTKVAFPPFSPQECQEKWQEMLQKMRKYRSLTELIAEAEEVIADPLKAVNKKMHPELPKRPSPSNAMFCEDNWAKFQKKHPEMPARKLFRLLCKKYQGLSDEAKAPYLERQQCAFEEYNKRMLEFKEKYYKRVKSCDRKRHMKRKRVPEDPLDDEVSPDDEEHLPAKPPITGYNLFCKEQLGSMDGISSSAYVSVWAKRWRDLTKDQRDEYSRRCRDLRNQYLSELNKYLKTLDKKDQKRILEKHGIKKKKRANKKKEFPGEPKMPVRSSNLIFFKEQMELLKEEIPNAKERFTKASQMWKDLPNKEKAHYRQRVLKNLSKYMMKLQKWSMTLKPEERDDYLKCKPSQQQYLCPKQVQPHEEKRKTHTAEEESSYRPSDSEDEDIEMSSNDEEEYEMAYEECGEEEEEEEEEDDIAFEMY